MSRRISVLGLLACVGLVTLCGCPTTTHDCSDDQAAAVSAATKFLTCGLLDISACEIQAVAQVVSTANPVLNIIVTTEQAQAAVDFLHANNVACLVDLQRLIVQSQQNPGSIVIPESLQALADAGVDFNTIVHPK